MFRARSQQKPVDFVRHAWQDERLNCCLWRPAAVFVGLPCLGYDEFRGQHGRRLVQHNDFFKGIKSSKHERFENTC